MVEPLMRSKNGFILRDMGTNSRDTLFDPADLKDMNQFKECLEVLQVKIIDLEVITKEIAASLASTDRTKALKLLRGTWKYPTRKIVRKIPSLYQKVIKSLEYFPERHANHLKMSQSKEISYEDEFKWWTYDTSKTESLFAAIAVTLGYNKEGTIYSLLKEEKYKSSLPLLSVLRKRDKRLDKEVFPAIKTFLTTLTGILVILNSSLTNINKIIEKEEKRRDYLLTKAISEEDFNRQKKEAEKRHPYE